jgi:hypothetical protein
VRLEGLHEFKNPMTSFWNQTHNLPACIVPQPTRLHRRFYSNIQHITTAPIVVFAVVYSVLETYSLRFTLIINFFSASSAADVRPFCNFLSPSAAFPVALNPWNFPSLLQA